MLVCINFFLYFLALPEDRLLADLLKSHAEWVPTYFAHDTLLMNKEDENLTEAEKKAAWNEYENEKSRRGGSGKGPATSTKLDMNAGYALGDSYDMMKYIMSKLKSIHPDWEGTEVSTEAQRLQEKFDKLVKLLFSLKNPDPLQTLDWVSTRGRERDNCRADLRESIQDDSLGAAADYIIEKSLNPSKILAVIAHLQETFPIQM